MARPTGPRNKLSRRLGMDLGLKLNSKQLERRANTVPGQHGRRGRGKTSDFGIQLSEKQKAKAIYGVLERQFKKYYLHAARTPQATGTVLLSLLERRLDNIVYRLGLAPTRRAARQLVTHGHVLVDGKKLSIPSCQLDVGQTITLDKQGSNIPYIKELLGNKDHVTPPWLARQATVGKLTRLPAREDITEVINEQLIVEYYSR